MTDNPETTEATMKNVFDTQIHAAALTWTMADRFMRQIKLASDLTALNEIISRLECAQTLLAPPPNGKSWVVATKD